MKKLASLIIVLNLFFTGCLSTNEDTAFEENNPKTIEVAKVYSILMYEDQDETYNKSYLKFIPTTTGYHTIHIGTKDFEDLDIRIFSDDEYSLQMASAIEDSTYGEILTFNAKANQVYYILVENYDNSEDIYYDLLVSPSLENGYYSKNTPMQLTLDKNNQTILTNIGYDLSNYKYDDNEDTLYLKIDSSIREQLYIKTTVTEQYQDLDIKVYSDNNYTDEIYTSTSIDVLNESLEVGFDINTTYYVIIQNFTNDNNTNFTLSIDEFN